MELELKAQVRNDVGKKTKTLRQKGFIPASVYGPGHKPVSIQVDYKEFDKIFEQAGESTILKLKVHGEDKKEEMKNVLIHQVETDPVSDNFIHVDFYQVQMDKLIKAEVELVFEGEAPAVKILEGIMVKNITKVEVEALPKDLPHEIKVDLSGLDSFDKSIRAKDLILPPGVKISLDPEEAIILVKPPRTEEEIKAVEGEIPKEVVEPELAKEKKEGEESATETLGADKQAK